MPLSPASGPGGGGNFNGGLVTGQVVLSESVKDTTPLQIKPVSGATADETNQLEIYDDAGNNLGWWDAKGSFSVASGNGASLFVSQIAELFLADNTSRVTVAAGSVTVVFPVAGSFLVSDGTHDFLQVESGGTVLISPSGDRGLVLRGPHAAPTDINLFAGDMALWFDQTNGAAKLMVKAKQADGTVVTGSLALA